MTLTFEVFLSTLAWLTAIFIFWRNRIKKRKINSPISKVPKWQGVNVEDIAKQWAESNGVHPAFGRQLCQFASSIEDILRERNPNCNLPRITLDDIDRLWELSEVVEGRGSSGQKIAYFAIRVEQMLLEQIVLGEIKQKPK